MGGRRVGGPIEVGVGAIVVRSSRGSHEVLLVRRRYPPFAGYWSFPGGHVEPGEPILEAARRELLEETGVEAEPVGVVHIHELVAQNSGSLKHYIILDVLMKYVSGEPRPGSDADAAEFVPLDEATRKPLTPGIRAVLPQVPRLLNDGCLLVPARTDAL
jgi:8-oxo-dGTP diphosphatase